MEKVLPSLKAMAEAKVDGIQKATYFRVDPHKVEFEAGFNLREEGPELDEHIEKLYLAMKAGADIPPIDVSVVEGRIIAREGHCRTRAARRLVDEGIPYQLEARQFRGNEVDQTFHMIGTAGGKALTPLEQGRGFLRLIKYGLTVRDISDRLGMHVNTINKYLLLAEAPVELQRLVGSGKVSAIVAIEAIQKHGEKAVQVLTKAVTKVEGKGGGKVTGRHVGGPKVTKKVAASFYEAATRIRGYVSDDQLAASDDPDYCVTVKASDLKQLLDAQAQCRNTDDEL